MTLTIAIPPETETILRQRAEAAGQDMATCAAGLLNEALRRASLEEVFADSRKAFEESGMTDDELGDFLEDAKHRRRAARRAEQIQ